MRWVCPESRVSVFSCPTSERDHWKSWSCVLNETPPKGVERVSPSISQKGILLNSHFLWKETSLPWRKERHSLLTRPRKLRKPIHKIHRVPPEGSTNCNNSEDRAKGDSLPWSKLVREFQRYTSMGCHHARADIQAMEPPLSLLRSYQ